MDATIDIIYNIYNMSIDATDAQGFARHQNSLVVSIMRGSKKNSRMGDLFYFWEVEGGGE